MSGPVIVILKTHKHKLLFKLGSSNHLPYYLEYNLVWYNRHTSSSSELKHVWQIGIMNVRLKILSRTLKSGIEIHSLNCWPYQTWCCMVILHAYLSGPRCWGRPLRIHLHSQCSARVSRWTESPDSYPHWRTCRIYLTRHRIWHPCWSEFLANKITLSYLLRCLVLTKGCKLIIIICTLFY